MQSDPNDFIGKRFNRLVVVADTGIRTKSGNRLWYCRCDCGKMTTATKGQLTSGGKESCKCLQREMLVKRNKAMAKHNAAAGKRTPEYLAWSAMLQRCYNPRCQGYDNYGGRGISVCDSWRQSFSAFVNDVGSRPSSVHSLDRINNDGNYEPSNVRWATVKEQGNNRRDSIGPVSIGRDAHTLKEWAAISGNSYELILDRLHKGWNAREAIYTPPIYARADEPEEDGSFTVVSKVRENGAGGMVVTIPSRTIRGLRKHGWESRWLKGYYTKKKSQSLEFVALTYPDKSSMSARLLIPIDARIRGLDFSDEVTLHIKPA